MFLQLCFLLILPHFGWTLTCWSCNQGYHASTPCSDKLPPGMSEVCEGSNPECVQATEWFQNGTLRMIRRTCYTPSANAAPGGYCKNFHNKVGVLKECKSCKTDLCNGDIVYKAVPCSITSFWGNDKIATYFNFPDPSLQDELSKIANAIVSPGKGILHVMSMGKRLGDIGAKGTDEKHRKYRQLPCTTDKSI